MTFEKVDRHVGTHPVAVPKNKEAAAAQMCSAYKAVKPILTIVSSLPLFPTKWKTALQAFIKTMNMVCP